MRKMKLTGFAPNSKAKAKAIQLLAKTAPADMFKRGWRPFGYPNDGYAKVRLGVVGTSG